MTESTQFAAFAPRRERDHEELQRARIGKILPYWLILWGTTP
jgi:hypothetical protein